MNYKIFDPGTCKPEEYRTRFPELANVEEFSELTARGLIFVWWFANQTSELVIHIADRKKRVEEALKRSGFNPGVTEKEQFLRLNFGDKYAQAIERMGKYDPGARFRGYKMINNIMQQYEELIALGPGAFKKIEGKGEDAVEVTDIQKYVNTSAKIAANLAMLIERMESGFGITLGGDVDEEELGSVMGAWHKDRSNEDK